MYGSEKVKSLTGIAGLIPALTLLSVMIITIILFGESAGFKAAGIGILFYALVILNFFLKTGSKGYLASLLYVTSLGVFVVSFPVEYMDSGAGMPTYSALMLVITGFFLLWVLFLAFKRKTKWKGREVLELAARNVSVETDSFTSRPHPVGKIEYTETEAGNFSAFLRKNLVAFPYFEENRIVIVPVSMGKEFGALLWKFNNYLNKTWVSFDKDGNIAVNISKQDYLNYKEDLSFDQLCNSLADIFIHFMELHKNGQEIRIIDELDSLRLNFYK